MSRLWRARFQLVAIPPFVMLALVALSKKAPIAPDSYVGDSKCLSCHTDKQSYLQTAHYLTSRLPTQQAIEGSFRPGQNILKTTNPDLSFKMDASATGFTETAVIGVPPNAITHTEKIDFVVGSGRKGQTYLYWKGDRLFELPVSYWTELNSWVDSPGYRDDFPNFERPVPPRCLECHASYFISLTSQASSNATHTWSDFGRSGHRQSREVVPGPASGRLRDVSRGHWNTSSSCIFISSRRTSARLHQPWSPRHKCQN